jgi:DNA/RNA-binding domain of Phe-tRNA-synthetase-like protein
VSGFFGHSADIWRDYPDLVPAVMYADGITATADVTDVVTELTAVATARLATATEAELPEIQAWRRTFSRMGLKPTQYRCASESLLRRLRKEGSLPSIHPLIDLCNAVSVAYAVPVAVFDVSRIASGIDVRHATGDEKYLTFGGETENPDPGEVVFADAAGQAHARRWTNRQSGLSAVRDTTTAVLIVAEAQHATARDDMERLAGSLADRLTAAWNAKPDPAILMPENPLFRW